VVSLSCQCGSGIGYAQCCEPFHTGEKLPETAVALMRSRYSAYCLRNSDYLLTTWEPAKRPKSIDFSKENVIWLRLEIGETEKGGSKDNKGVVSFKAFFSQDDEDFVMRETSRFVKNNGQWFYSDGVGTISKVDIVKGQSKNGTCHCGSGKKFKRCCGAAEA